MSGRMRGPNAEGGRQAKREASLRGGGLGGGEGTIVGHKGDQG